MKFHFGINNHKLPFPPLLMALPLKLIFGSKFSRIIGNQHNRTYLGGSDNAVSGNGEIQTEVREVTPFRRIDVGSAFHVDIACGPEESLTVTADSNLLEYIETEVVDDTLRMRHTGDNISPTQNIEILVTAPYIEDFIISGASKAMVTGIENEHIRISVDGAAKAHIAGTAEDAQITVSGAAKLDAQELHCTDLEAKVSGAGKASVYASNRLAAEGSGAGKMNCYGSPEHVNRQASGAAKVTMH